MAKKSKSLVTVGIIVLCVAAVLGFKFYLDSKGAASQGPQARVKGNPQADIKIVEYIDFECPACAEGAKYLKKYMEEHPDDIYLEMKYFPLGMHKHAILASTYAECAARQQKFWPVHDLLIERQRQWKRLEDAEPAFKVIAEDAQLDLAQLQVCIENPDVQTVISKDRSEGDVMRIQSTPTYFINGQRVVGYQNLMKEILALSAHESN